MLTPSAFLILLIQDKKLNHRNEKKLNRRESPWRYLRKSSSKYWRCCISMLYLDAEYQVQNSSVKRIVFGHIWCLEVMVGMFLLVPELFDTFLTLLSHRSRWPFSGKKTPATIAFPPNVGKKKKKIYKKALIMKFLLLSYKVHCRWTGTKHQEIKCKE